MVIRCHGAGRILIHGLFHLSGVPSQGWVAVRIHQSPDLGHGSHVSVPQGDIFATGKSTLHVEGIVHTGSSTSREQF